VKLDSEEQRAKLVGFLEEVPVSVKDQQGRPLQLTAGMMRKGPPPEIAEMIETVENAEIEETKG
jgi:hypothetical protein